MRRKSLIPDGKISRGVREGLAMRATLLKMGTPEADVDRQVGQVLKRAWQASLQSTRTVWHYVCARCKDTGWVNVDPSVEELERLTSLYGPGPPHEGYVIRCEPCLWNQREREKRRRLFEEEGEGFVTAVQRKRKRR